MAHYPCPQLVVFNNWGEFEHICDNNGIKAISTTSYNSQANTIGNRYLLEQGVLEFE